MTNSKSSQILITKREFNTILSNEYCFSIAPVAAISVFLCYFSDQSKLVFAPKLVVNHILLVEDRQSDVDLIEEALQESNLSYTLHVVRNGEEALNFLYKRATYAQAPYPKIILLDLNLPRLDGSEVLSIVKNDPNLQIIPIIVLSTSKTIGDILQSYTLRANCYINKPFDLEQFLQIIQTTVRFWLTVVTLPF